METLESKIAKYGKSLITNLYILVRITDIYDSMNETILNTAKRLLANRRHRLWSKTTDKVHGKAEVK